MLLIAAYFTCTHQRTKGRPPSLRARVAPYFHFTKFPVAFHKPYFQEWPFAEVSHLRKLSS